MREAASSTKDQPTQTGTTWTPSLNRIPQRIKVTTESIFSGLNGIKISLPEFAHRGDAITIDDNARYYRHQPLAPTIPATASAALSCSAAPSPAISIIPKLARSSLRLERV